MNQALLHLLAEPKREAILRMVWREERSAGDIAAAFEVPFSAISQHLAALLAAGLVERRRDGRRQYYRARPETLGPLARALEEMWFGALSELKALAEAEQAEIDSRKKPRERTSTPPARSTSHEVRTGPRPVTRPRRRPRRGR